MHMHDDVRNKQRSKSADMKTLKSQIDLRKQGLGLNNPDNKLFLNHEQFSVAELLTYFEKLTLRLLHLHLMVMLNPNWEENQAQVV